MGKMIGLVVVGVLLVGGLLYWNGRENQQPPEGAAADMAPEKKGVVASIQEAMGLGQKMQCTYASAEAGSAKSTVVIDGTKFKSTTVMDQMTIYALFDGENQYSWTSAAKTGMKISKACLEKMQESMKDVSTDSTRTMDAAPKLEDVQKTFDAAKNVQCEAVASVDFTLPKDVAFTDQCAMLEQSAKMMEEIKDKLPAGMTLPPMPMTP